MVLNGDTSLKGLLAVIDGCSRSWSKAEREATGRNLLNLAKQARISRRFDLLETISNVICDLLPDTHFSRTALYYKAYCEHRKSAGGAERQRAKLEAAVDIAPPNCKPSALLALACSFLDTNQIHEFAVLSEEAARTAKGFDLLSQVHAFRNLAISRALLGDHASAISILASSDPIMREVAVIYPADYVSHLNSLALEMGEVGQVDHANRIIACVLRTPFGQAQAECHDTKTELASKRRRAFTPFTLALGALTVEAAASEFSKPSASRPLTASALGRATSSQILPQRLCRLHCAKALLPSRPRAIHRPTQKLLAAAPPFATTNRGYAISPPARAPPTSHQRFRHPNFK